MLWMYGPRVICVGPMSHSHMSVDPACGGGGCEQLYDGDDVFGSPIDVSPVNLDLVDDDGAFGSPIHVGPEVNVDGDVDVGLSLDSPVEVGRIVGVLVDEVGPSGSPIEVSPVVEGVG